MICKACNEICNFTENEDCFGKALDVLKNHYAYFRNALQQRDMELQQVKERNEKLNKALELLQKSAQPAKRFKSDNKNETLVASNLSQEDGINSDRSLTDDEPMGLNNLNVALNSEQLFEASGLSQTKSDGNITASSEILQTPWLKESPKRNKQHDNMRSFLKDRVNRNLPRTKTEWHTKERNSPVEKSWATKFLQPTKTKAYEEKISGERKKTSDKKLCLSLKKSNPAKIKQSLLPFNTSKDTSFRECESQEEIIDDSPVTDSRSSKIGRSWTYRSGHNYNNSKNVSKETTKSVDNNDSIGDIVFDFSPSKKTDFNLSSPKIMEPKELTFGSDGSKDCISLPKENIVPSENKLDTSSVVILTPVTQDIIFVDDTEIDTMDLLADVLKSNSTDNLGKLKSYESKCIQEQQKTKDKKDLFKKPLNVIDDNINSLIKIKSEENFKTDSSAEEKPNCSKSHNTNSNIRTTKLHNPLLSSDEHDTEDDDVMPKPFIIKQEPVSSEPGNKLSIKQRFNIDCEDCEDCEKLINFLGKGLTDAQIQEHLNKCKRHNNPEKIMQQNTPVDFWNPFILSFQADDPRNEVLIDKRFKENKN